MTSPGGTREPSMRTPILITPVCGTSGCNVAGDQYTVVRYQECGHWFCPDHSESEEGVVLVYPARLALSGPAYYRGLCIPCQQTRRRVFLPHTH